MTADPGVLVIEGFEQSRDRGLPLRPVVPAERLGRRKSGRLHFVLQQFDQDRCRGGQGGKSRGSTPRFERVAGSLDSSNRTSVATNRGSFCSQIRFTATMRK